MWSKPEVISAVRQEILPLVKFSEDPVAYMMDVPKEAALDITRLEDQCSLLLSCYRETIRLANQITGSRYVTEDTILSDESNGHRSYLLKKGTYITWSAKQMHRDKATWGNAHEFLPWRFVPSRINSQEAAAAEKKRRQAYVPFGGGKHLCPGRNFALAENLGFMGALALGFDVFGLEGGCAGVRMGTPKLGEALPESTQDVGSMPVTIRRREGWEDVTWRFAC